MIYYDLIIIGGGLAGSLFFAGLKHHHPQFKILLLEKNDCLGGNHTWCFHENDVPPATKPWLTPLISKSWSSHEVRFPRYERILNSRYHCIQSHHLHEKLMNRYAQNILLQQKVLKFEKTKNTSGYQVHLENGQTLLAHCVVDASGWRQQNNRNAWQKFVGLELKLKKPHGLSRVILKDATIPQVDGYRFFYVLPLTEDTLLIEDTYYSNHPILKAERIEIEIEKYAQEKGWEIEQILRKESGCLPLSLYPDTEQANATSLGAASFFFNPVTGYTFPQTILCIDAILQRSALTQESLAKTLESVRSSYRQNEKYFRLLNRMMFLAAEPLRRYLILERFYQLQEDLIQRFYSGQLRASDKIRILMGKPPVSVLKACKVFFERS